METKETAQSRGIDIERWERETLNPTLAKRSERKQEFTTVSLTPIQRLYTPLDLADVDFHQDIGFPGEYPFTRGIYPTMHRGRFWTMRQFAGFGTAFDTNKRFKYLLDQGQTGLSVAFDVPTLMGIDSDDPASAGEVGKCGVAISSLEDMEVLFDGIPLETVTTSMTINAPASVVFAMYLVVAEKQGADWKKISGTIQNDILKEFIAQKEWIYPPVPSMRLVVDSIVFCTSDVPRWHPVSISGYHIREAGSTALQELAFTLRDGIEYVQSVIETGLDVDAFAPRLSFFFNSHNDFFEEIAKFRAARRVWAKVMRERFKARDPQSWMCRFHTQTAGCSLTAQQPYTNVVRTAVQALAAILGGTQSLHTNSLDEALALPTEQTAQLAIRTQQILAHESGVINTVDPLGGSYFVETLTNEMERGCWEYFEKIDAMGGMIGAIEHNFPQREIHESAFRYQQAIESGEKTIVAVNDFVVEEEQPIQILYIDDSVAGVQQERLSRLRAKRDQDKVTRSLDALKEAARGTENTMPYILECVRAYATLGEISYAMRDIFGEYREPAF